MPLLSNYTLSVFVNVVIGHGVLHKLKYGVLPFGSKNMWTLNAVEIILVDPSAKLSTSFDASNSQNVPACQWLSKPGGVISI